MCGLCNIYSTENTVQQFSPSPTPGVSYNITRATVSRTAPKSSHYLSTPEEFMNYIPFAGLRQACTSGAACFGWPKVAFLGTVPHSDTNEVNEATKFG